MKKFLILSLSMVIFIPTALFAQKEDADMDKVATFAGGCFWCMEPAFDSLHGVHQTTVGYMGGNSENPSYSEVSSGKSGHAEAIQVRYNPQEVSYEALLKAFWSKIDPTQVNGQFADRGSQYRTAIFYHDDEQFVKAEKSKKKLEDSGLFDHPIVTEIIPAGEFFPAEEYHQDYYQKNPDRYEAYYRGSGRKAFCQVNLKAIAALYDSESDD